MVSENFTAPKLIGDTKNLTFDFRSITMYDGTGFGVEEVIIMKYTIYKSLNLIDSIIPGEVSKRSKLSETKW